MSNNNDFHFRSSLKGFHRGDVLSYLEQMARNHVEERNELAGKLDSSQKELSELRTKLEQADNELQKMKSKVEAQASEIDELKSELAALHSTNSELHQRCAAAEQELNDLRSERDTLSVAIEEYNAQKHEIEAAKLRVAEIELDAYTRAKNIENNAIENANLARKALSDLITDAKRSFDSVKDNANNTLHRMALDLESLKESLLQIPENFSLVSKDLDSLKFGNEKKSFESTSVAESKGVSTTELNAYSATEVESLSETGHEDYEVNEDEQEAEGEEIIQSPDACVSDSPESGIEKNIKGKQGYTYSFCSEDD